MYVTVVPLEKVSWLQKREECLQDVNWSRTGDRTHEEANVDDVKGIVVFWRYGRGMGSVKKVTFAGLALDDGK